MDHHQSSLGFQLTVAFAMLVVLAGCGSTPTGEDRFAGKYLPIQVLSVNDTIPVEGEHLEVFAGDIDIDYRCESESGVREDSKSLRNVPQNMRIVLNPVRGTDGTCVVIVEYRRDDCPGCVVISVRTNRKVRTWGAGARVLGN